jgi:hypothetical protein
MEHVTYNKQRIESDGRVLAKSFPVTELSTHVWNARTEGQNSMIATSTWNMNEN